VNGYVCFYNSHRVEVHAKTTYEAQKAAQAEFEKLTRRKVKGYQITVHLAEKDGQPVEHTAVD
jgi:hypothetical protein